MKNLYIAALIALAPTAAVAQTYGMMERMANLIYTNGSLNLSDSGSYYFSQANPRYFDTFMYRYSYDYGAFYDATNQLTGRDTQTFAGNKIHTNVFWQKQGSGPLTLATTSQLNYTTSGKLSTYTYYMAGNGDSMRITYTYDVADRLVETMNTQRPSGNPAWTPISRATFTYNSNGEVLTELRQEWMGVWVDQGRTTYGYTNGLRTDVLYENYTGGNWVNSFRMKNTYTGTRVSKAESEFWNTSGWEPAQRQTYAYNSNGLVLTETTEMWQTGWKPQRQNTWQYLPLLIIEQSLSWNAQSAKYELQDWDREIHRHFPPLNSVKERPADTNALNIYPIPAQNQLYIDLKTTTEPVLLYLCSIDGKVVQQAVLNPGVNTHMLDVSGIASGNYILRMSGGLQQSRLLTIAK